MKIRNQFARDYYSRTVCIDLDPENEFLILLFRKETSANR